jgi:hypothetical protein
VLIVLVLLVTVLLRLTLIGCAVYLLLPRGPVCRQCDLEMARIRNRGLERLFPWVERRWCMTCGWSGIVRRAPPAAAMPRHSPSPPLPAPPTWE